ncbi:MAG: hypothetical protein KY442_10310 [Proteobacteria bacterium]|nr:hypothetical protein [Pseudomonadota bacterium]
MATLERLKESLDSLERFLPAMMSTQPDPEAFWITFSVRADLIREGAGSHADYVWSRLDAMLAGAGMGEETTPSLPGYRLPMGNADHRVALTESV